MEDLLASLNEEQIKPVLDTEGAVLVLAGAGSGKTRVLTTRIAYLVEEKGVHPSNILSITFTNKAANEMRERLLRMTDAAGMWICTIHSMCVRILRMFASRRGLSENFSIYSDQEQTAVLKQIFKELGLDKGEGKDSLFKNVRYHISAAKTEGLSAAEYAAKHAFERDIEEVTKVFEAYTLRLRQNNALDFDDLLSEARALLAEDAEARGFLAGKFLYIHVDEFQDTNAVQFDIIRMLASVNGNLFAVGDDDQSIYRWRGARIENILHFNRSFPEAKVYKLQRNYRSTKRILELANASIAHNTVRNKKTLWTENAEGDAPVYFEAQDEAGDRYRLTLKMFELSSGIVNRMDIMGVAKAHLERLAQRTGEAVHLVIRDGQDIVYLYKAENGPMRMASRVGLRSPLYCTGVGKAILATLPPQEVEEIWARSRPQKLTGRTITDLAQLRAQLDEVRANGYAIDDEENELGVRCVAVAIPGADGRADSAFSIRGQTPYMTAQRIRRIAAMALDARTDILADLGLARRG